MNKVKYDFNEIIERKNTNAIKWSSKEDIIPMWIADMDFKVAPEITESIKARVDHGVFGYDFIPDSFYDSIIKWVKDRYNWAIEKEWMVVTPGVVPGLGMCVKSYTEEGDKVLLQSPVYFPFYSVIENNKRIVAKNPLINIGEGYMMDFENLETVLDDSVKMALFCNPHNPVGKVWKREDLIKFGEACLKNNTIIVSDEIHCDLTYKNQLHFPIGSLSKDLENNTVTFMAPSKTFNIAGLYTSVAIIPNEDLRNKFSQTINNMGVNHTNALSIVAFESAYNHGGQWLEGAIEYIEENAEFVVDYINENIPMVKTYKPEGTYLMWLDFNKVDKTSKEIGELLLNKGKVWLSDGSTFGNEGDKFFRINIGCPRELLIEGLKRIKAALE